MSGIAGYKAQLRLGGVPTVFTDEPLVQLNQSVFRINDSVKRVISANHPVTLIDSSQNEIIDFTLNYLEGVLTVGNYGDYELPFYITGRYIPLLYIGGSKEYSIEIGGDVLDDSSFHSESTLNAGYRTKVYGIHDISVSFSKWNDSSNKLTQAKINKTPIFVSINPGGSTTSIKGWFYVETDSLSGEVGSLEDQALSLVLSGNNSKTYFSYSINYTEIEASLMDEIELVNNYFFN